MYLIALVSMETVLIVLQVAFALGMVIFVHELGHFAVAKWCGVKCEKFYLGFDIFGLKLAKYKWGETEYGIGILPLGGYVKMLGQEDNPARIAEEIERAKQVEQPSAKGAAAASTEDQSPAFDPRSYLAQSVGKRMAIISAGVVMNVIFAVVVAMIAFNMGVKYMPCIISRTVPGSAAWREGIRPGDEIVQIGEVENPRFRDLRSGVILGDVEQGVPLVIRRPGREELLSLTIHPDRIGLAPTIGVTSPVALELDEAYPTRAGSAAGEANPAFRGADRIVAVDGTEVNTYAELQATLARKSGETLRVTVERVEGNRAAQTVDITVAPDPVKRLGLIMTARPIIAVEKTSPAAEAGIRAGDRLLKIDGAASGDPMTVAERLRGRAGETVTLTIERKDENQPLDVSVTLREVGWFDWPPPVARDGVPMSVAALGIAYEVQAKVNNVLPDSPAARANLKAGDTVVAATVTPPKPNESDEDATRFQELSLKFSDEKPNWPALLSVIQEFPPGTKVKLTLADEREVSLEPVAATDWFNPERGLRFQPIERVQHVSSLRESAALAGRETLDSMTMIFRLIQRLVANELSPKLLGGPLTIAIVAGDSAKRGMSELLIFLCLLSTNLAVINFLPIPLLDGGHMMFLTYEAVRGKPPSERLTIALQYAGFLFILSLMGFVLYLDALRGLELWGFF